MDYPVGVTPGDNITPGSVYMLGNTGMAEVGNYTSNGSNANQIPFFCIDVDTTNSNVIGLTGNFMVELDSDLYVSGNYSSNLGVTASNGKISIPGGSERIIAYVINYSSSTGKLVLTWKDN